jgi:N-acetylglucosaminyldiphosphoundecaprenol N-acetyl-beta-D-mannosaminyltransferase
MPDTLEHKVPSFNVLDVQVSAINMDDAVRVLENCITTQAKGYVSVCPVSTIMECVQDAQFREIVNQATLVTPDGMPCVWIGKRQGFKNMGRVYGPDLMLKMCEVSSQKGYKNYFYGATDAVLEKLKQSLKESFPSLNIVGTYAPPFRPLTPEEDQRIVDDINRSGADLVWVGLGSPKQDRWIYAHRAQLNASVLLGVGAAFDFLSGTKPQAPRWMQRAGLEWFFRLCSEPQRLWKRYLVGNTQFLYLLAKQSFKKKLN